MELIGLIIALILLLRYVTIENYKLKYEEEVPFLLGELAGYEHAIQRGGRYFTRASGELSKEDLLRSSPWVFTACMTAQEAINLCPQRNHTAVGELVGNSIRLIWSKDNGLV